MMKRPTTPAPPSPTGRADRPLTIALANSGHRWIGEVAHVAMLYEQFEALGHRPWIVCSRGRDLEAHARRAGWRCLALEFNRRFHPWLNGRDVARWVRWARRERCDVIHCHRGKDHWPAVAVAKLIRRPLIRTRHVVMPVRRHLFNRWLFLRATDAVVCVSEAACAGFGPWRGRLPRGRVILAAVDGERFNPTRRSETWRRKQLSDDAPEPIWFGHVGRFQNIKGQHVFLDAAARVAAQRPEARFLLAGRGSNSRRRRYESFAHEHGFADRLLIAGMLDDLPEAMASLDVGVIASLGSEGSSRIALEMMASSLPVVGSRVGAIAELIAREGQANRVVEPGDAEAMGEAMLAFARDAEARRSVGETNRRLVLERHQPRQWAEQTLAVYRETLTNAK